MADPIDDLMARFGGTSTPEPESKGDALSSLMLRFGRPEWSDPSVPVEEKVRSHIQTSQAAGRSYDEYAADARRRFGVAPSKQAFDLEAERQKQATEGEGPVEYIARRGGLGGPVGNWARSVSYGRAREAFDAGKATPEDLKKIARFERLQQIDADRQKTTGGAILEGLSHVPGILSEAAVAGPLVRAGMTGLGLAARAPSLGARLGIGAAQTAATTAAMPSMYLEQGAKNRLENPQESAASAYGRAFTYGALQTAVLGRLANPLTQGASKLGAVAKRTPLGMAEQQVVDAIAGTTGLTTGYGLVHDMLRGKEGEGWKHLATQAVTFAAFAALHARTPVRDTLADVKQVADAAHKQGLAPEDAQAHVAEYLTQRRAQVEAEVAARLKGAANLTEGGADWQRAVDESTATRSNAGRNPVEPDRSAVAPDPAATIPWVAKAWRPGENETSPVSPEVTVLPPKRETRNHNGDTVMHHDITDASGKPIGEARIVPHGEDITIQWIGKLGAAAGEKEAAGAMQGRMRGVLRQIGDLYPNAQRADWVRAGEGKNERRITLYRRSDGQWGRIRPEPKEPIEAVLARLGAAPEKPQESPRTPPEPAPAPESAGPEIAPPAQRPAIPTGMPRPTGDPAFVPWLVPPLGTPKPAEPAPKLGAKPTTGQKIEMEMARLRMAAAQNEGLKEIADRMERGERVDPQEMFDAAGLTPPERHALAQSFAIDPETGEPRGVREIAGDPEMGGVSHETVRTLQKRALAKLGEKGSAALNAAVARARGGTDVAQAAAALRERGRAFAPEDVGYTAEELAQRSERGARAVKARDATEEEMNGIVEAIASAVRSGAGSEKLGELHKFFQEYQEAADREDVTPRLRQKAREVMAAHPPVTADHIANDMISRALEPGEGSMGNAVPADFSKAPPTVRERLVAAWRAVKAQVQGIRDNWKELAGSIAPRITQMDPEAGNKAAKLATARAYVNNALPFWKAQVLDLSGREQAKSHGLADADTFTPTDADKKASGTLFMTGALEERFRHAARAYGEQADALERQAAAATDAKAKQKLLDAADEARDQAENFDSLTFVGSHDSLLETEAQYQRLLRMAEYQDFKGRWEREFGGKMRDFFRLANLGEMDSLSQLPGFTFTAVALKKAEPGSVESGDRHTSVTPSAGKPANVRARKLGATNRFKGTAEHGYETDPEKVMEYMANDRVEKALKADFYRAAVRAGGARLSDGPPDLLPDGRSWKLYPDALPRGELGGRQLYMHPEWARESDKIVGLHQPWLRVPGSQALTKATLLSFVEAASHGKNLMSMVFKPGMNPVRLARHAWDVLKGNAETKRKLIDLAELGAMKEKGFDTGFLWGGRTDPTVWSSKFLDFIDSAVRLTAADAYESNVKRYGLKASEGAKRDFINQAGQYNKRGQNDLVAFLRETGVGPFATAATNFTAQGLRALFGSSGLSAPTLKAAAGLRAEMYARIAVPFAVAAVANAVLWGRGDGDDNTPLGGLKVGVDANGKSQYLDLGALTGLPRGARTVGVLALAEGLRADASSDSITKKAVSDVTGSLLHPAEGPAVAFVHGAVTGTNTLGLPISKKAGIGENQELLNLQGALANANPVLGAVTGADRPREKEPTAFEQANRMFGPLGVKHRATPPGGTPMAEVGERLRKLEADRAEAVRAGQPFKMELEYRRLHRADAAIKALGRHSELAPPEVKQKVRDRQLQVAQAALGP